MKKTDKLKKQLQDKIITMDELDITMEDIGYNLVEIDDNENNVIKVINEVINEMVKEEILEAKKYGKYKNNRKSKHDKHSKKSSKI